MATLDDAIEVLTDPTFRAMGSERNGRVPMRPHVINLRRMRPMSSTGPAGMRSRAAINSIRSAIRSMRELQTRSPCAQERGASHRSEILPAEPSRQHPEPLALAISRPLGHAGM